MNRMTFKQLMKRLTECDLYYELFMTECMLPTICS